MKTFNEYLKENNNLNFVYEFTNSRQKIEKFFERIAYSIKINIPKIYNDVENNFKDIKKYLNIIEGKFEKLKHENLNFFENMFNNIFKIIYEKILNSKILIRKNPPIVNIDFEKAFLIIENELSFMKNYIYEKLENMGYFK